ncbi:hypothetical protein [Microcystis sp. LE19-55.1A]|uniref:hypothetical protein n=1 Tax=Microcystis sp. LE19-55.1A TaxID=3016436 RepID=UPI0022C60554|nr:hypothetical protein [Microcystis sp. LE19-55.1A]MCZ8201329.1 hypothetical protein [Microcystis sp. LE19-55.1A]
MVSEFIELRSPTGNNNRPTGNNQPARFLGIWGDFGVIWAHAMRPYGFLGGWAHAMRPYGFWTQRKAKNPRIKLI